MSGLANYPLAGLISFPNIDTAKLRIVLLLIAHDSTLFGDTLYSFQVRLISSHAKYNVRIFKTRNSSQ